MAKIQAVPDIVIGRLPIYLRALKRLAAEGQQTTSSQRLAELLGASSAQIRKDLSHFGEFGKQGTGYNIPYLTEQLAIILNVDRTWKVAVVGAGPVVEALLREGHLARNGFQIVAVFDQRPEWIGLRLHGMEVQDTEGLPELAKKQRLRVAILAVPVEDAQKVAEMLVEAGIRAILSYAPVTLSLPAEVWIETVDPVALLQRMVYYV